MNTRELPIRFGADGALVGVVSLPDGAQRPRMACLLFNAGVIHRIGPHRLNVRLARALAADGMPALRFDFAGSGDSAPALPQLTYREQVVRDAVAAMDYLEGTLGVRRFLMIGICSGAVNGFWAALADERVAGAFLFDGFWYRSAWTAPVRMWKRLAADPLGTLRRSLAARWHALRRIGAPPEKPTEIFDAADWQGNPPKRDFAAFANALVARGVNLFFLYGGSILECVSYGHQLRDAFRGEEFVKSMRCELHEDIDHTVVSREVIQKLIRLARDWARAVPARE